MRGREKYDCPECGGTGQSECECCGSDQDCEVCNSSGLNPKVVDFAAIKDAQSKMTGHDYSSELKENGEYIGRVGRDKDRKEVWRLLYADFAPKEHA